MLLHRVLTATAMLVGAVSAQAEFISLAGSGIANFSSLSADGTRGVAVGPQNTGYHYTWSLSGGVSNIGGIVNAGQPRITADGSQIVMTALNPATGKYEFASYDWTTGSTQMLGSLGSFSGTSAASVWGLSGDGSTVVGLGWISGGTAHAMSVRNGVVSDLGSLVSGRSSRANSANYDGSVIVGWQDQSNGARTAAIWVNGVESVLTTSSGSFLGEAADVSNDGNWVVGQGTSLNSFSVWRWSAATGVQNLFNPGAGNRTAVSTISDDGGLVLGYTRGFSSPPVTGRGWVWSEATGKLDLTDLALSQGINLGGVTLAMPSAISADGMTIAGTASNNQAFVLRLNAPVVAVPEPTAPMLMSLGLVGLWFLRRQRSATP